MDELRFTESGRDSLITFLVNNNCDEEYIDEIIEDIENTLIIYEKSLKKDQTLPKPKQRKQIIENALKGHSTPDWLNEWTQFGDKEKVLRKLLECELKSIRPTNIYRDYLLISLAEIYTRYTGLKPSITWRPDKKLYEGKFIEFIKLCLTPLHRKPFQGISLGKSIQRLKPEFSD